MSLILSLDSIDLAQVNNITKQLRDYISYLKLGHIMFSNFSHEKIKALFADTPLFFDFKFFDIPNTVSTAIKNYKLNYKNLKMVTIWATANEYMISSALHAHEDVKILGVISLTSDSLYKNLFLRHVEISLNRGLNNFICPATILEELKSNFGDDINLFCPGIRFENNDNNDQKQVMTPKQALDKGADYIIMGRPLLNATDPLSLVKDFVKKEGCE